MLVEKDSDLETIERTGAYNGIYFVLGGTIPFLEKEPERFVRSKKLVEKVSEKAEGELTEIILALSAVASQILALVRDRIFAHNFGTGEVLDAYYAAFRIPDFIFVTVATLFSMTILIPAFTGYLERDDKKKAREFISSAFNLFLTVMIVASVIGFFLAPVLAKWLVPGFAPEALKTFIFLTRIILLQPIFIGLSNLIATVVQTHKRFFIYALTPILYNLGIMVGALFFYPYFGVAGLAYGVVLGALAHLLVQVPTVVKAGFWPKFSDGIRWSLLRKTMLNSIPRTITLGVHQVVLIVITGLASALAFIWNYLGDTISKKHKYIAATGKVDFNGKILPVDNKGCS